MEAFKNLDRNLNEIMTGGRFQIIQISSKLNLAISKFGISQNQGSESGKMGVVKMWWGRLKVWSDVDINDADVAQLGEHETEDLRVAGSIPAISTFLFLPVWFGFLKIKPIRRF